MKKVLFVLAIVASLTACNNATETSATSPIDSARIADSIKAATKPVMDTASKKIDTASKKIDSAVKIVNNKMDSVKKK